MNTTTAPTLTDLLFEKADIGLCLVAPDGTIVRANAEWLRSTGFSSDEVVGEDIVGLFPDARDMALAMHARARAGHRVEVPRHAVTINGRETWWEGTVEPVPMDGGAGLLITAREVMHPRSGARESRASAAAASAILDARDVVRLFDGVTSTTPDFVYIFDLSGRFIYANRRLLEVWGMQLPDVIGKTCRELGYEQWHHDMHMREIAQVIRTKKPIKGEVPFKAPLTGIFGVYEYIFTPVLGPAGDVEIIAGTTRDVTDRKRSEEALRESEARLRLALNAGRMVAWEFDPVTKDVKLSDNAREVLLTASTDRLHESSDEGYALLHPDDVAPHRALVEHAIAEAGSYVSVYRQLAAGREIWLEERGRAVTDDSGRTIRLVGVTQNITDRKAAEDALRVANARLVEADHRKDEFLAMLAHELRNPLAPIRNATYILRHAQPGTGQAERAQEVIERQSNHLTRLVDDLLDVTRIARGKIELRREHLDLREIVGRAADDFRFRMDEEGVTFRVIVPDAKVHVDADPTRLAQVVGNLLHNASKFTRRGDEVVLALAADGAVGEIRVRDTGAGIEEELLPRIFEPFVQADQSLARTQGGLGLGLALVKGIVELHGGSVRAESAGIGRGAELVVRIPLVEGPTAGAAGGSSQRAASRGRRVLVVDDNADSAQTLADIVEMFGHTVVVAFDGPSAVQMARASAPEIVFCDLGLPGMSGYEVARALRALGGEMQLFAFSGYAQPEDVRRSIEAGFDGHIAKPADIEQLERLLG